MLTPLTELKRRAYALTRSEGREDLFPARRKFHGVETHLSETLGWLLRAVEATGGKGVAAHYHLRNGWGSAYPETTGYIVPLIFVLADRRKDPSLEAAGVRLAEWLLTTQKASGGFPGGEHKLNLEEVVFNTGQIVRGLTAAFERTRDRKFLSSGVRAGEWLCSIQSDDGAWRKFTSPLTTTREHAYDVLSAWGLFRAGKVFGREEFCAAALRQYEWTLAQQLPTAFFRHAGFEARKPVLTHPFAYVIEGLFEMAEATKDWRGLSACRQAVEEIRNRYEAPLPGVLDETFERRAHWSCVTGDLQLGWMACRIGKRYGDARVVDWGRRLIETAVATQRLSSPDPGVRGGVFGSSPIWGGYFPFTLLNWAAKYLLEALLMYDEASPPRTS